MSISAPSLPTTGTWNIDGVHSTADFSLTHNLVATFRAQFLGVSGSLENGVLTGEVPVEGINLSIPIFKEHLLSEGWFDAANHPNLTFSSSDIHAHDDGTVHLNGELTIRGVTKPISASGTLAGPAEVTLADGSEGERLGINLTTTIDRREFGLETFAGADWNVTLDVALQLAKA